MILMGESRKPPPDADRVEMLVHPSAREALTNLLYDDSMRAVGFSEFILRAVEWCRQEIKLYADGGDIYEETLREQAEYHEIDIEDLRAEFRTFLNLHYREAHEQMDPLALARCIGVYRVTKLKGACRMSFKTMQRRDMVATPQRREEAKAALHGFMEGQSELRYAAGWLTSLHEALVGVPGYDWLRACAGGTWVTRDEFVEDPE